MIHRYLAWRKTIPLVWRILADIGMVILAYYAVTTALYLLVLILPLFALLGLASGGKKCRDDEWFEENNDQMGGQPKGNHHFFN